MAPSRTGAAQAGAARRAPFRSGFVHFASNRLLLIVNSFSCAGVSGQRGQEEPLARPTELTEPNLRRVVGGAGEDAYRLGEVPEVVHAKVLVVLQQDLAKF